MPFLRYYAGEFSQIWNSLSEQWRPARADSGVSLVRQLLEILVLRAGEGKLLAQDYYKLRVYRDDLSFHQKRKYMSDRAARSLVGRWEIVADDKLLTYSVLSDFGIAIPKIYAICHKLREYQDSRTLRAAEETAAYLRYDAPYPVFAKPVHGRYSRDTYLLERYDSRSDTVQLAGGGAQTPDELGECFVSRYAAGYILQELLRPHQAIREFISDRICTLRVIVRLEGDRACLFMAVWKINLGDQVADNYWRDGNVMAKLDQESGEILQCMTGLGANYRLVEHHPKTGRRLAGFQVPCYRETIDLALHASKAFPDIPMQAWDIAITDAGPVPLELNVVGSLFIPQLVNQKGLWSGDFREFVLSHRRGTANMGSRPLSATRLRSL